MLLSVCGTAIATLASRFKEQQNTDFERILQRLVEIIAAARVALRVEALDDLERETDDLLAKSLAHDWSHALTGSRLAATSLGLTQARQAISERRAALSGARPRRLRAAHRRRLGGVSRSSAPSRRRFIITVPKSGRFRILHCCNAKSHLTALAGSARR